MIHPGAPLVANPSAIPEHLRRRSAWIAHFFDEELALVRGLIAAGEFHPEPEEDARIAAKWRAMGDARYRRGEWPPVPEQLLEAAE